MVDLSSILSFIQSPLFIYSLIFWLGTYLFYYLASKKKSNAISFIFPVLVLLRVKWFNKFFHNIGSKHKKTWKMFWNVGLFFSFAFMFWAVYFFSYNLYSLITSPKPENAIVPLIPGVTIGFTFFTYLIIPLLITITVHEMSHAIAAENDGIKVQSSGIFGAGLFFLIGFGAFVEVDENQLKSIKVKSGTRMRVAAAGVWSNMILAAIFFLLTANFNSYIYLGYQAEVIKVDSVLSPEQGGYNYNSIFPGDIITHVNGTPIDTNRQQTLEKIMRNETSLIVHIGDSLNLTCINERDDHIYYRTIKVGARYYLGFDYNIINSTSIQISKVVSRLYGGNNQDRIFIGDKLIAINDFYFNYSNGKTLEYYLTTLKNLGTASLLLDNGTMRTIYIDYYPLQGGCHAFRNVYLGFSYIQTSNGEVKVNYVFKNETEYGVAEGKINDNIILVKVNGTDIPSTNLINFDEFIKTSFNLKPGDILIFTDSNGKNYSLIAHKKQVYSTLLGILDTDYWLASNWLGSLLGPKFPSIFYFEALLTWLISLSVAIFNLLPASIFDGGRLFKEVLYLWIKPKYLRAQRIFIQLDQEPEEDKFPLQVQMIEKINSVKIVNKYDFQKIQNTGQDLGLLEGKKIPYSVFDDYLDGYIDSIEINYLDEYRKDKKDFSVNSLSTNSASLFENREFEKNDSLKNFFDENIILIEALRTIDKHEPKRNKIYHGISLLIGGIVILNFIISIIKFGSSIFWL